MSNSHNRNPRLSTKGNISVIIPTYNRPGLLVNCIHSLINQAVTPQEIVIVDNYTKDPKMFHFIKKLQEDHRHIFFRLILCEKKGTSFVRNKGVEAARGPIIALIDDDCIADRQWINSITYHFTHISEDCALVGRSISGHPNNVFSLLDEIALRTAYKESSYVENNTTYVQYIDTKNFAIKKNTLTRNNIRFDEQFAKYNMFDDYDLAFQLTEANIPIIYEEKMIVKHYGRETALKHIDRDMRIGLSLRMYQGKLASYNKTATFSQLYSHSNKIRMHTEKKRKQIQLSEEKKIFLEKGKWFLFQFLFWRKIGSVTIQFGRLVYYMISSIENLTTNQLLTPQIKRVNEKF